MKMAKRFFTMVLALMMVLSLAVPAFATDIVFTGGAAGAEYSAYKLLNATSSADGIAYTVNDTYLAILQSVTGKTEKGDIITYISLLDAAGIRDFADDAYAAIKAAGLSADLTTNDDKMEGAAEGYYLIAETKLGTYPNGATDSYSLVMVDTVGKSELTIITKESVPVVEKTVENKNDSTGETKWGEHADFDIGDTINFKIEGTLSGKYDEYKNYAYQFVDNMSEGLTLIPSSIKITIGSIDITNEFKIVTSDHSFTALADLKAMDFKRNDFTITHNSEIYVTYSAILNENAVIGSAGNLNTVVLKYENDPYVEYDPSMPPPPPPGVTPPDVNIVFTFEGIINKVKDDGTALEGAGFSLYKWNNTANDWVIVGSEITGVTTFNFPGLDVGEYKLVETTVPDGYKKAADIEFEIVAEYDTTKDPVEITALHVVDEDGDKLCEGANAKFHVDLGEGEVETNVVNKTGVELPQTGGIGTTMFYVFGTIMVLGAAVLLITKKRMNYEA